VSQLAVVAYPVLSDDDRRWIEGLRARHDPQARRISAHITLVFPAEMAQVDLVAHTRSALQGRDSFSVVLRHAVALPDAIRGGHYVSLPVSDGQAELSVLHDVLYGGILAAHRGDVPFAPHLTLAAHPKREACERIANELNGGARVVRAGIDGVEVIEVREAAVLTVATIPLGAKER
jgi:2'-5' RNA ligase